MPPYQQYPGQPQYLGEGNFAFDPSSGAGRGQGPRIPSRFVSPYSPDLGARAEQSMMYPVSQGGGEAFLRSVGRDVGGPFAGLIDRPHAGVEYGGGMGGFFKRLATMLPYLGTLFKGGLAAQTANKYQGYLADDPAEEGFLSRLGTSITSSAGYLPGGQVTTPVRRGVAFASGLAGAPSYFDTSFGDMFARAGGMGTRQAGESLLSPSGQKTGPYQPSGYPFFGESPTAGGEWMDDRDRYEGGGGGGGMPQQNWASPWGQSAFGYERG